MIYNFLRFHGAILATFALICAISGCGYKADPFYTNETNIGVSR